jgi:hypothetical protein
MLYTWLLVPQDAMEGYKPDESYTATVLAGVAGDVTSLGQETMRVLLHMWVPLPRSC